LKIELTIHILLQEYLRIIRKKLYEYQTNIKTQ